MAYGHGKDGAVKIKGYSDPDSPPGSLTTLCVKKWEADLKRTKHDTSSTCTSDWQEFQVGKKVVEFNIEAQLDLSNSPIDTAGADLQADYCSVELYALASASPTYDIAKAVVDSIKITSMENDIITYAITGTSSGAVTISGSGS